MAKKKPAAAIQEKAADNEAQAELEQLMTRFDNAGVSIEEVGWRQLTELDQRSAVAWLCTREKGGQSTLPTCLNELASNELLAETDQLLAKAEAGRMVLMPVIFKNAGYEKLEDGSLMIKLPLRCPDTHLGDRTARDIFGDKHVRVEISRRAFGEWDQSEMLDDGDRRIISFESDITRFGWSDDHYLFMVRCDEDTFAGAGVRSGLDEAIGWAGKQGSIRLTVLGDVKGGEPPLAPGAAVTEKRKPGRPKKTAAPTPATKSLPGTTEADLAETFSVALTDNFEMSIKVSGAPENKFACEWYGKGPSGSISDMEPPVRASLPEAVKASIGRAIDFWLSYVEMPEAKLVLEDLREWLMNLEAGKSPKLIEAEMDAEDEEDESDVKF